MTGDDTSAVLQFLEAGGKLAHKKAAALFAELCEAHGPEAAHAAFAKVLSASSARRGQGRRKVANAHDQALLVLHDAMPGQALAAIGRAIADLPQGRGRTAITIQRRLSKLLADRASAPTWDD